MGISVTPLHPLFMAEIGGVDLARPLSSDALAQIDAAFHRHRWRQGDLVIWDNRCTMHRACGYDDLGARRIMHRTTVSDEVNSVEGQYGLPQMPGMTAGSA
ncbi:MAG: TauD/TfdA dioxygenase family protein [Alphaproteobacteria bacterium]